MTKFLKNTRGAVTVFVSLLLIPAMLVTGTAVDLARIHTAQSTVQNANQLAANSVLTQYHALLQDLYGLFGVMQDDPILADLVDRYIMATIFGAGNQDTGIGTFQLFYGDRGAISSDVSFVSGQHLANPAVLRRQIEEYVKFRGPVVIVTEILDRLDLFGSIRQDADAIDQQMRVNENVENLFDVYREVYNQIRRVDSMAEGFQARQNAAFGTINEQLGIIRTQIGVLLDAQADWQGADDNLQDLDRDLDDADEELDEEEAQRLQVERDDTEEERDEAIERYNAARTRIRNAESLIRSTVSGLSAHIQNFQNDLDELVRLSGRAESQRQSLERELNTLENRLNSASEPFRDGMHRPGPNNEPSTMEMYRALLAHRLPPLAEQMRDRHRPHLVQISDILNGNDTLSGIVGFGSVANNNLDIENAASWNRLANIPTLQNLLPNDVSSLRALRNISNITYHPPAPNNFSAYRGISSAHREFWDELSGLMFGAEAEAAQNAKDAEENRANSAMREQQSDFRNILNDFDPDGANSFRAGTTTAGDDETGLGDDWGGGRRSTTRMLRNALSGNIIREIGDLANTATNQLLLVTYASEMFSNYTTEENTMSMAGIPMGTQVNYFFQSELEYLFHGNQRDAVANIRAVARMILLVRFVFNYIATFVIDEIGDELRTLSAPAGKFKIILREFLRLGMALGESVIDVRNLMINGEDVPLMKTRICQWTFSLLAPINRPCTCEVRTPMYYRDYLRIFLFFRNGDVIAERVSNLIGWNVTNYSEGVNANEGAMTAATQFNMARARTGFEITSQAEIRMLFLSMPFAQRGIDGIRPSTTFPVRATALRGY